MDGWMDGWVMNNSAAEQSEKSISKKIPDVVVVIQESPFRMSFQEKLQEKYHVEKESKMDRYDVDRVTAEDAVESVLLRRKTKGGGKGAGKHANEKENWLFPTSCLAV
jgi:hypothetical protein